VEKRNRIYVETQRASDKIVMKGNQMKTGKMRVGEVKQKQVIKIGKEYYMRDSEKFTPSFTNLRTGYIKLLDKDRVVTVLNVKITVEEIK